MRARRASFRALTLRPEQVLKRITVNITVDLILQPLPERHRITRTILSRITLLPVLGKTSHRSQRPSAARRISPDPVLARRPPQPVPAGLTDSALNDIALRKLSHDPLKVLPRNILPLSYILKTDILLSVLLRKVKRDTKRVRPFECIIMTFSSLASQGEGENLSRKVFSLPCHPLPLSKAL